MDLTPPELEPAASGPADPCPHNAPPRPPPRERAPWTHLSNAHEASNGPAEYRASLEHDLPDVTGPGLHGYTTAPAPPGTPTQEWEDEYAVDVTDMTAYVESVEDPEQDTVLSLLAYHSWRWGHRFTLHRPQDGPHKWSPEQTAKWDIVLQLTPEGFYILTHSGLPDATPNAQALPLAQPQEDDADAPPPEECNWDPPTATTERMPHRLTKASPPPRLPCHQRLARTPHTAPAVGITRRHLHVGGNPPRHRGAHVPVAPGRRRRTRSPPAHTSSSA